MKTLIVAPHPDDELLGCGGTVLRRIDEGASVAWLLVTSISEKSGWSSEQVLRRSIEIDRVREGLRIDQHNFYELNFPAAELENIPKNLLVKKISDVFHDFEPEEVLLPYAGDAHSDHRITFEAASACTKWFRNPSVKRVLAYETPSETGFGLDPFDPGFKPNVFIDISEYLEAKIKLMSSYVSEMGEFPFPRSEQSLRSLAHVRGAQAGFNAAEAFMLLLER